MQSIYALTLADLRAVSRDSLLKFLLIYPLFFSLLVRWLVPYLTAGMADQFDLRPYWPVLAALFGVLMGPVMGGVTIGFLLLDERDDRTLLALQVTPMSMNRYLAYRLLLPVAIGIFSVYLAFPVMALVSLPSLLLTPIALLSALLSPVMTLILASFANNKVQGFAVMKAMGPMLIVPAAAWFVPEPWQWALGIVPTYWPVKATWMVLEDRAIWLPILAGTLYTLGLLWLLLRRFNRVIYRLTA